MTRVGVSDPGSPGEPGQINVHFFWRRVYCLRSLAKNSESVELYLCLSIDGDGCISSAVSRREGRRREEEISCVIVSPE